MVCFEGSSAYPGVPLEELGQFSKNKTAVTVISGPHDGPFHYENFINS